MSEDAETAALRVEFLADMAVHLGLAKAHADKASEVLTDVDTTGADAFSASMLFTAAQAHSAAAQAHVGAYTILRQFLIDNPPQEES